MIGMLLVARINEPPRLFDDLQTPVCSCSPADMPGARVLYVGMSGEGVWRLRGAEMDLAIPAERIADELLARMQPRHPAENVVVVFEGEERARWGDFHPLFHQAYRVPGAYAMIDTMAKESVF